MLWSIVRIESNESRKHEAGTNLTRDPGEGMSGGLREGGEMVPG